MSPLLAGKVALVTGGSRGIGAAIVRRLADEGAAVAFTYSASPDRAMSLAADIRSRGGKVVAIAADSADPDAVKQAVGRTVTDLGRLDILVNNAGILIRSPVGEFELVDVDRLLAV